MKIGRRILMPAYVDPAQKSALVRLARAQRRPQQEVLREALSIYLTAHREQSQYVVAIAAAAQGGAARGRGTKGRNQK